MDQVVTMEDVTLLRQGRPLVEGITWTVREGERWVVLGANGAGKTSLLRLAAAQVLPSEGTIHVLGSRIGRVDMRDLRTRIGFVSPLLVNLMRSDLTAFGVVLSGAGATLGLFREYREDEKGAAAGFLELVRCGHLEDRPFARLSDGERQRVLLARALMAEPSLLVLDEPASSLDLRAREELLGLLTDIPAARAALGTILVTHRVEDVPAGFTHALLLRDGHIVRAGPINETLTDEPVSQCFEVPVEVVAHNGRFWAVPSRGTSAPRAEDLTA